ncbi:MULTISPECIES: flavodoxin-dependent (E)-4-hydroxy-3-methylbut-2-enyl-diphosphate synthase [Helicobacter]|uniref:flavodoxin-dependent (E)-4-hydroxy-3-methylbut-2-enyl-diphosphate synthase n=1 Tax=Helicobacter TaxID=209 RepID=UPI00260303E7|nr:flavodoxin-dependent (E)-4-hydroxy-3-methylbut-2-enyl-diphosphate synthase [Helicobacter sp. UBA3407]
MESHTLKSRYKTKQIAVGDVLVGGDAPISVQSMTYSKTADLQATKKQIDCLQLAGCDIVRVAVSDEEDAKALKALKSMISIPLVADIHFRYKFALVAAESVDCVRINPGNIGSKDKIKAVVNACQEHRIPIRIGVNAGSLEKPFEVKYGATPKGMVESALYNIKLLEDFGFTNLKISLKASDVERTMSAYRMLRPLVEYPFHLGVTEAGDLESSMIKSSIALGGLLMEGIGDTMRVSITGELEKEIEVAHGILRYCGRQKEGITYISCPTCGRLQADLVPILKELKERMPKIKTPMQISVMGCAVNALGEAKHADVAIAFGSGDGLVIKHGEIVGKYKQEELIDVFIKEVVETEKEIARSFEQ